MPVSRIFTSHILGLTQLGLRINAAIAAPNQGRLNTIIGLIEESDFSIHDLSRIELSRGVPRLNMPVELGVALYRSHATKGRHRVLIFESRRYRAQRSTSNVNGIDAQIHKGTPKGLMSGLRNIFPAGWRRCHCSGDACKLSRRKVETTATPPQLGKQITF